MIYEATRKNDGIDLPDNYLPLDEAVLMLGNDVGEIVRGNIWGYAARPDVQGVCVGAVAKASIDEARQQLFDKGYARIMTGFSFRYLSDQELHATLVVDLEMDQVRRTLRTSVSVAS